MDMLQLVLFIVASPWILAVTFVAVAFVVKILVWPFRSQLFAFQELNFIQKALDGPTGKRWTAMPCLSDHIVIFFSHITKLFGAYTGCCGAAIEHDCALAIHCPSHFLCRVAGL